MNKGSAGLCFLETILSSSIVRIGLGQKVSTNCPQIFADFAEATLNFGVLQKEELGLQGRIRSSANPRGLVNGRRSVQEFCAIIAYSGRFTDLRSLKTQTVKARQSVVICAVRDTSFMGFHYRWNGNGR